MSSTLSLRGYEPFDVLCPVFVRVVVLLVLPVARSGSSVDSHSILRTGVFVRSVSRGGGIDRPIDLVLLFASNSELFLALVGCR